MRKDYVEEVTKGIITYFKEHEEAFNECIEQLDDYCGYLDYDRRIPMDYFDEYTDCLKASTILRMVFYGGDEDRKDANGIRGEFNPNREYFFFNGAGNLCSTDCKDYSCYLDEYAVECMLENREEIYAIEESEELSALFNELVAAEEAAAESGRVA